MKSYLDLKPGKGYFVAPFSKQCIVVEAEGAQIGALFKMLRVIDTVGREGTPIEEIEKQVLDCNFAKYLFKNYDCLPPLIKELFKESTTGYLLVINNHSERVTPFDVYYSNKLARILATRINIDNIRLASLRKDN